MIGAAGSGPDRMVLSVIGRPLDAAACCNRMEEITGWSLFVVQAAGELIVGSEWSSDGVGGAGHRSDLGLTEISEMKVGMIATIELLGSVICHDRPSCCRHDRWVCHRMGWMLAAGVCALHGWLVEEDGAPYYVAPWVYCDWCTCSV
ncbi:hypothetical protein ACLOJK_040469 [Asimina triloba]